MTPLEQNPLPETPVTPPTVVETAPVLPVANQENLATMSMGDPSPHRPMIGYFLTILLACIGTGLITFFITRGHTSTTNESTGQTDLLNRLTPNYTGSTPQHAFYNYLDGSSLTVDYPQGFSMQSDQTLFDTLTFYPAVGSNMATPIPNAATRVGDGTGSWNGGYLTIFPDSTQNPATFESYQRDLQQQYDLGAQPHQKFLFDVFLPDYTKPFPTGYETSSVGKYTCYYFKAEEEDSKYKVCHIFGAHHEIDVAYLTNVAAGDFGPGTPSFNSDDAEKIIATLQFSSTNDAQLTPVSF